MFNGRGSAKRPKQADRIEEFPRIEPEQQPSQLRTFRGSQARADLFRAPGSSGGSRPSRGDAA
jgi:hypothetical protein